MSKLRVVLDGAAEMVPRAIGITGDTCGGRLRMMMLPLERLFCAIWVGPRREVLWAYERGSDTPRALLPVVSGEAPQPERVLADMVATAQQAEPRPVMLRGQWKGTASCDPARQLVMVMLTRQVTTYGMLTITSDPTVGWRWAWTGKETWFQHAGVSTGELRADQEHSLALAIESAMAEIQEPVKRACSFRDTHRRGAVDVEYGQRRPVVTPRESFRGVSEPRIQPLREEAPPLVWNGVVERWEERAYQGSAPQMRTLDVRHASSPEPDAVRALSLLRIDQRWKAGVLTKPWHKWPAGTVVAVPPDQGSIWLFARRGAQDRVRAAEPKPPKAQKPATEPKPAKAQKPAVEAKPPKAQKPSAEDRQLLLDGFRDVLRRAPDLED